MALPTSGPIDFAQIAAEVGLSLPQDLGNPKIRMLGRKPSGPISFFDFYGKAYSYTATTAIMPVINATWGHWSSGMNSWAPSYPAVSINGYNGYRVSLNMNIILKDSWDHGGTSYCENRQQTGPISNTTYSHFGDDSGGGTPLGAVQAVAALNGQTESTMSNANITVTGDVANLTSSWTEVYSRTFPNIQYGVKFILYVRKKDNNTLEAAFKWQSSGTGERGAIRLSYSACLGVAVYIK